MPNGRFGAVGRPRGCTEVGVDLTGDVQEQHGGPNACADVYLSKPFSPRQLVIRIKAMLNES